VENDEEVKPPMIFKASCSWEAFLLAMIFLVMWVVGWVLAKGFISTFFAVIFFPWGWYLIAEKIMLAYGWV
jgi:hypothetical protein